MTTADRLRLFVAAPVPAAWHAWLVEAQQRLEQAIPGYFRMTRPAAWHLTVLFLGSQPADAVPAIRQAVQQAASATPRFALRAGELSAPGQLSRPRLVWLECDDGGVLTNAHRQLASDLNDLRTDSGQFRAHITLGRARKPSVVGFRDAMVEVNQLRRPDAGAIDQLVLFRSYLEPHGARYEPLLEFELQ